MSTLSCQQGHPNPSGSNFCSVCGESLTETVQGGHGPPTLLPGNLLRDRYRIHKALGSGGFGRTYLVEDTGRFDERLVLKEFAPAVNGTFALKKAVELFRREAITLYQLEHPQIPKFWEIFQAESRLFLVEDFVEGHTYEALLNERIRKQKTFSEAEVLRLFRDLLPVLTYIHQQGIIHRDISPDNIILSARNGLPILIDMGAAKQTVINATIVESVSTTPRATSIGKTGYSPDEQIRLGMVAPYSDLYALAVTAIVLMTGKQPNQLLDPYSLQWNWEQDVTVHPTFAQVINRMLAPRPDQRFPSANEVLDAIAPLLNTQITTKTTTEPTAVSTPTASDNNAPTQYYPVESSASPPAPLTPVNPSAPTAFTPPAPNKYYSVSAALPSAALPSAVPPVPINSPTLQQKSSVPGDFIPEPLPVVSTAENNSGSGRVFDSTVPVPEGVKGWSWGAFLLGPFWSIGNKVWIGLITFLAWINDPGLLLWIGVILTIVLAIKGNEWAWKSKRWASVERFKATQKKWTVAGIIVTVILVFLLVLIEFGSY